MNDEHLNPRVAERLVRAVRAARALSEALWEGLHEELNDPRARRVSELSERLADVSLAVASLARETDVSAAGEPFVPPAEPPPAPAEPRVAPAKPEPPAARVIHQAPRGASVREEESPSTAVLIDELAPEGSSAPPVPPASSGPVAREPSSSPESPQAFVQEPPEIEIRDERGEREREQSAWVAAIGRRLERYERDGAPFAVLLIELADVERLRHAELPGEMARLTGLVEAALAGELRPADSLTRESPGRYWLLAAETDAGSAQTLAARLAEAVRAGAVHRGTPLEVAMGIAVCPADGTQAAALAVHADVALYAARAAGRPVT